MTLRKYICTYKFTYVLFCNPTHKTEIGTVNRWGTTNSKPPGRIIMMSQIRNTVQRLDHIYYTLFCRCIALLRFVSSMVKHFLPAMAARTQLCEAKTIFLSQTSILWIFFINFYCARTSTRGDALSTLMLTCLHRYLAMLSGYPK